MLIIGCDYHPGLQQIAFVDTDTGELNLSASGIQIRGKLDLRQLLWHRHRLVGFLPLTASMRASAPSTP
jgi:hypothetical protein